MNLKAVFPQGSALRPFSRASLEKKQLFGLPTLVDRLLSVEWLLSTCDLEWLRRWKQKSGLMLILDLVTRGKITTFVYVLNECALPSSLAK